MSACVFCEPEKIPNPPALMHAYSVPDRSTPCMCTIFPFASSKSAHVLAVEFGHGISRPETRRPLRLPVRPLPEEQERVVCAVVYTE
jgi:hypothetical protein